MSLKRKRHEATPDHDNKGSIPSYESQVATIRALLPPSSELFMLEEFVKRYAPKMKLGSITASEVQNIAVSPLHSIVETPHITAPTCREPLPSLVDDVVWDLVQRRDRQKRLGLDNGKNVLAQGYVSQSVEGQNGANICLQMRPGVVCIQPNEKVSLCKSKSFQILHHVVGDDILRMMLLHTRLFVPMGSKSSNFIYVCGPPLVTTYKMLPDGYFETVIKSKSNETSTEVIRSKKLKPNATLSNSSSRYSEEFIPKVGLQESHPLNTAISSEKLLGLIVDLYNEKGVKRRKRWRRLRVTGINICDQIKTGHSKCDYARLLERYCPLPAFLKENDADITLPLLVQSYTAPEDVTSFIASVLKRVFPPAFWGSEENFTRVIESVKLFVSLRQREKLTNKELMNGIKITSISWLAGDRRQGSSMSRSEHQAVTSLTLMALRWLIQGYIIPLLRVNFYVTESEFKSNRLLYYRRPVWSKFRSLSMKKLLQLQFSELPAAEARRLLQIQRTGFSRLRLLPKSTGVRPIAQLGRVPVCFIPEDRKSGNEASGSKSDDSNSSQHIRPQKRIRSEESESNYSNSSLYRKISRLPATNVALSEVFHVLSYECSKYERPYGAGLDGLESFYPRYRQYIVDWKKAGKKFSLYFTSVDIEKCYDNINQKYLFELVKGMISQDDYFFQQFNMFQTKGFDGNLEKISKKFADPQHHDYQKVSERFEGVVFDSRNCNLVSKKKILELLKEHLHSNLVAVRSRNGNRGLLQSSGISQGSSLSMMLCNLYYGKLESLIFGDTISLDKPPNFMARLVDDFIFITTKKKAARTFLEKMYTGKPELGAKINEEKTVVSESIKLKAKEDNGRVSWKLLEKSTQEVNSKNLFPWCGMLFDTLTGEVFVDYSRFHGGKTRDTLMVLSGKEGEMLSFKMKGFVRPRCTPILYDSSINSFNTIVTNYFQMMLLGAVKYAEYLRCSHMSKSSNLKFLLSLIDDLSLFACNQIKSNLNKKSISSKKRLFILTEDTTSWLTWKAFLEVFSHLDDFSELYNAIYIKVSNIPTHSRLKKTLNVALHLFDLFNMLDFKPTAYKN